MLVILAWVEFSVRCRIMRNVSPPIAVAPSVHLSGSTAPRKERCWQLSPCVYSFVHTCAALGSPSGRITSLLFGSIGLRIQKVWWLGGCMPFNSFSSQLSTGPAGITVTLTGCLGSLLPLLASALAWIAPRWTQQWRWWISRLMRSWWGTRRMLTSFPYSLGKIGWLNLMMTCPDRPLRLGRSFVLLLYNSRMPRASRCWNGSGLMCFLSGQKWRVYARKYGFCGISVIAYQQTQTEWYGGREVHTGHNYICWCHDRPGNHCFWPITLGCLAVIWAGIIHWPVWVTGFTGLEWLTT